MKKYLFLCSMIIFVAIFSAGCSASHKCVKDGSQLQEMGNHYGAALKYIEALRIEPTYEKAKLKLCEVAKMAYDQKLLLAQSAETSLNYEQALREYSDLKEFLMNANSSSCITFSTINADNKIAEMKSSASEKYYKEAESLFKNGNYIEAVSAYDQALHHNNPYKDSTAKISESYYRFANNSLKQNSFRDAAKNYILSNSRTEGYKDASKLGVKIYYALGKYYLSKKQCRKAWEDFDEARKIDPNYKDLANLINTTNECAVTKIAFMEFDNKTGRDIAGMAIGDFIFDELKTKIQKNASRFVQLLDRENVNSLLAEQNMGMKGITDDYATFKQLKGVDYLIFGKITQVRSVHQGLNSQVKGTQGEERYRCQERRKDGKVYETWCERKVPIRYELFNDKISVAVAGSTKVISVATGSSQVQYSINEKEDDSVNYADNVQCNCDGENTTYDKEIKRLMGERKEIADEDSLGKKIIDKITDSMSQEILKKIDITPNLKDPISLKLE